MCGVWVDGTILRAAQQPAGYSPESSGAISPVLIRARVAPLQNRLQYCAAVRGFNAVKKIDEPRRLNGWRRNCPRRRKTRERFSPNPTGADKILREEKVVGMTLKTV
jgi:hypothetical protein